MSGIEIRESHYPRKAWTPEAKRQLVAKNLIVWDSLATYYRADHVRGKQNWDYLVGDMFTEAELTEFHSQDKLVLRFPDIVQKVNALEGMQISGRREGTIVGVGGEDGPGVDIMLHLLKDIKRQNNFDYESTRLFTNAIVSGLPSYMFFDRKYGAKSGLCMYAEAWDAVFEDPGWQRIDLSDSRQLVRVRLMSKDAMKNSWPEMTKEIEEHVRLDWGGIKELFGGTQFSSEDRDKIFYLINSSLNNFTRTGMTYVIERYSLLREGTVVWVSPNSAEVEVLPSTWRPSEIQAWIQQNPDYQQVKVPFDQLWVTTCTANGLFLENEMHWYQEQEFPAVKYVPRIFNNRVWGVVDFLKGALKAENVARMEHLHSLRMTNDDLMIIKKGALVNVDDATREKSRTGGILVRSEDSMPDDISFPLNHREQMGWQDFADRASDKMDRLSVDRNFEGGMVTSQESGKAIQQRNAQSQMKYTPHISSYNLYHMQAIRKILKMTPYVLTEPFMLRYVTKTNQTASVEMNSPEEYDPISGEVTKFHNNLAGAKYDYIESESDNSATARENEMNQFVEIAREVLPSIPDPSMWPYILTTIPNKICQDIAAKMIEKQQADAEAGNQPEKVKLSMSMKGEDLLFNPAVLEVLKAQGVLPPDMQLSPEAGAGQPSQQGAGQPMMEQPQAA